MLFACDLFFYLTVTGDKSEEGNIREDMGKTVDDDPEECSPKAVQLADMTDGSQRNTGEYCFSGSLDSSNCLVFVIIFVVLVKLRDDSCTMGSCILIQIDLQLHCFI